MRTIRLVRVAAVAVAVAVAVVTSLVSFAPAGAGGNTTVGTNPGWTVDHPSFLFEVSGTPCVAGTQASVTGVDGTTLDLTDPNHGTVHLPAGTPGGIYDLVVTCTDAAGQPVTASGAIDFASVSVIKVVTGAAPADAAFAITVACEEPTQTSGAIQGFATAGDEGTPVNQFITGDLTFDATGGTATLVGYRAQECTITETDAGGALASTIETEDCLSRPTVRPQAAVGTFVVGSPLDCTETVTNEFAPAPPPPPPASPIPITPAFTG